MIEEQPFFSFVSAVCVTELVSALFGRRLPLSPGSRLFCGAIPRSVLNLRGRLVTKRLKKNRLTRPDNS